MEVLAYIRPDKNFAPVHEQLQMINAYATANGLTIDDEFIDQTSQNKKLAMRNEVAEYFQNRAGSTLILYDAAVLSMHMDDIVQMFSCLLKNAFTVHFVKQSLVVSQNSSAMVVLGVMDDLRQKIQNESKRVIGRPRGSRSDSKFDMHIHEILNYLQESRSVSEMARLLGVSRSSLKDFIESRELKLVAFGSLLPKVAGSAEEQVISRISCPHS